MNVLEFTLLIWLGAVAADGERRHNGQSRFCVSWRTSTTRQAVKWEGSPFEETRRDVAKNGICS